MKYYSVVLTVLRFIAVSVVLYHLYRLACIPFGSIPGSIGVSPEMAGYFRSALNHVILTHVLAVAGGVILYLIAPFATRFITAKNDVG